MEVKAIVACDLNGNIGKNGTLPWNHLKDDMIHFRRNTSAGPNPAVIMGRKTWDSIPERHRPLKNRMNIVVSTTMNDEAHDQCSVVSTPYEGVTLAKLMNVSTLWVIGGASVYEVLMKDVDEVHVTIINATFEDCDTQFPSDDIDKHFTEVYHHDFFDDKGCNSLTFKIFKQKR